MSIDLTLIQNLLDTRYGIGADKRMLLAHIDAYERLVPGLIVEVERARIAAEPTVDYPSEWALNLASNHLSRQCDGTHHGNVVDLAALLDGVRSSCTIGNSDAS